MDGYTENAFFSFFQWGKEILHNERIFLKKKHFFNKLKIINNQ